MELKLQHRQQTNALIKQLQLHQSDGILRCKGRFLHADINAAANSSIILPKKNYFTDLFITNHHAKLMHQGVRHTVTSIHQEYWIPSMRQQVRSAIRHSQIYIHWEGPPYRMPIASPLPADRITQAALFLVIGCDFAGPLFAFNDSHQTQTYTCIFTYAVTRAIHLELVDDLTSKPFLLALRKFVSRPGLPATMISDNARTFKLAKTSIERLWHNLINSMDTTDTDYVANSVIRWKFNAERAPWWGGFFERMMGLVKRTLLKTAQRNKFSLVQLATLLTEIEAILNSRPLTYVYSDSDDGHPLTPNNFLIPGRPSGLPSYQVDKDTDFAVTSSAS